VAVGAPQMADQDWNTYTCRQGFGVQGVHGSMVTSVARSLNQNFIATTENDGSIRLYKYPSLYEKAPYKESKGHSLRAA
jgi:hypothetical protein